MLRRNGCPGRMSPDGASLSSGCAATNDRKPPRADSSHGYQAPEDPLRNHLPLVDQLAWGHLLERRLDGGPHRHLVGRGAREIGIEIDPRVRVQGHYCEVIGLIGHAPVEAAILDHDVGRDMASSCDLFPRQTGGRVAELAGLLRRVLQPVALSAVLQDEPLLIDGVPEGLAQSVWDGDQLWHRVIPRPGQPTGRRRGTGSRRTRYRLGGLRY